MNGTMQLITIMPMQPVRSVKHEFVKWLCIDLAFAPLQVQTLVNRN